MKATNSASTIVTKFHDLETGVGGETYEMEEPIHGGSLALASGTHIFFHGPPGVAKSYLVDRNLIEDCQQQAFSYPLPSIHHPARLGRP